MAKPYDATLKHLCDSAPDEFIAWLGQHLPMPAEPPTALDADLSTASPAADRLYRFGDAGLLHVEFAAAWAGDLPEKALVYNVLAGDRHNLPVKTALVLLRRAADSPRLTGQWERGWAGSDADVVFRYAVLRIWRMPAEELLAGPLAMSLLAPLADDAEGDLPGVVKRWARRMERERPAAAASSWTALQVLMGLRYDERTIEASCGGAKNMRESVIYQKILGEGKTLGLQEGRQEGRREGRQETRREDARRFGQTLRRAGERRFGVPSPEESAALAAVEDLDRLERMFDQLEIAAHWAELLATP